MIINIGDELLRLRSLKLLKKLLVDKTTKKNIMWATDAYRALGAGYERNREMDEDLITGMHADVIKTRARKAMEQQSERTKQHAEVFTPLWVVKKMVDHADEVWFGVSDMFFKDVERTEKVKFPADGEGWQAYVDSRRMEITCGEAPYLATRYDVETGEAIPVEHRIGILDRKLRVVTENAEGESEWLKWAYRALEATYGYEFQGDNLLIARVNVLMTFAEHLQARFERKPTERELSHAANIIVWNVWQMDGLSGTIPYCKAEEGVQISLFELLDPKENARAAAETQPHCMIYNWRSKQPVEYLSLKKGRNESMKFDYIIGNPPYQDEAIGENVTYAPPIYHLFMEEAYKISDKVELIHPARFLFNAGSTPKDWNRKMLSDPHFKVLHYEQKSAKIFADTDIKGGVAISYRDAGKKFGAIENFIVFDELRSIAEKVGKISTTSLMSIIFASESYRFTDKMHADHPEAEALLSDGHKYDLKTSVLENLDGIAFEKNNPMDADYVQILGLVKAERVYKWIKREYIKVPQNFDKWKIFLPKSNGSGALGEVLSTPLIGQPLIGQPLIGHTQSFMSIGSFDIKEEAESLLKYVKTKFARVMLGILKITQDNPAPKWKYVPMQDFTVDSDIDWSQSVSGIDRQLYRKYGLDQREIEFIESHVKEME